MLSLEDDHHHHHDQTRAESGSSAGLITSRAWKGSTSMAALASPPVDDINTMLTPSDVARRLGVSVVRVKQLDRPDRLPATLRTRFGRLYASEQVEAFECE